MDNEKFEFLKLQLSFSLLNHMMDHYLDCNIPPKANLDIFAEKLANDILTDSSLMSHFKKYFIL